MHSIRLPLAIVLAALILAGALVFVGLRYAELPTEEEIAALIERRLAEQGSGIEGEALDQRIEQGIYAFIDKQQREAEEQPHRLASKVPAPSAEDHIYGDPKAPLTLIEYSDFECPYCKRFHTTAKALVDRSNGKINWVYRHYPLPSHNPGAQKQAEASECAAALGGNDAFWRYTNTIYQRTRSGGKGFAIDALVPLAVELGLPEQPFRECLDSGRFAKKVEQQLQEASEAGISGTPGNILYNNRNGEVRAVHGARPLEHFYEEAERLLQGSAAD